MDAVRLPYGDTPDSCAGAASLPDHPPRTFRSFSRHIGTEGESPRAGKDEEQGLGEYRDFRHNGGHVDHRQRPDRFGDHLSLGVSLFILFGITRWEEINNEVNWG